MTELFDLEFRGLVTPPRVPSLDASEHLAERHHLIAPDALMAD